MAGEVIQRRGDGGGSGHRGRRGHARRSECLAQAGHVRVRLVQPVAWGFLGERASGAQTRFTRVERG